MSLLLGIQSATSHLFAFHPRPCSITLAHVGSPYHVDRTVYSHLCRVLRAERWPMCCVAGHKVIRFPPSRRNDRLGGRETGATPLSRAALAVTLTYRVFANMVISTWGYMDTPAPLPLFFYLGRSYLRPKLPFTSNTHHCIITP